MKSAGKNSAREPVGGMACTISASASVHTKNRGQRQAPISLQRNRRAQNCPLADIWTIRLLGPDPSIPRVPSVTYGAPRGDPARRAVIDSRAAGDPDGLGEGERTYGDDDR